MKRPDIILVQTQLFRCHREERSNVAITLIHLKRLPRPFRARNDIVKIYIAFILVQKKLLSVKIGKILEGGTRVKDVQVENVKSKSELNNFIHFPWKACKSDHNWVPPQFWKREKLAFRDVKGR